MISYPFVSILFLDAFVFFVAWGEEKLFLAIKAATGNGEY